VSKSLLSGLAQLRKHSLSIAKGRLFLDGTGFAMKGIIMTKTSAVRLAILLSGFSLGVVCGALVVSSSATRGARETASLAGRSSPSSPLTLISEVAVGCGVYGLPGSPAVVALTAGVEGRPIRASVESDLFGGEELEACVLSGLTGLPMSGDTLRVVLPVYQPQEASDALATR
jgi:hypothetical protein